MCEEIKSDSEILKEIIESKDIKIEVAIEEDIDEVNEDEYLVTSNHYNFCIKNEKVNPFLGPDLLPPPIEEIFIQSKASMDLKSEFLHCSVCEFLTYDKTTLCAHLKMEHQKYLCPTCDFEGFSVSAINAHSRSHQTVRSPKGLKKTIPKKLVLNCDQCDFKFAEKSRLAKHMKRHTGEKPFKCTLCSAKFYENYELREHMYVHLTEKPFACPICDFRGCRKSSLQQHMNCHSGVSYNCDLCDYKTYYKKPYEVHLRTHSGEKPFGCDSCDFRCADKGYLIKHNRIHTGEKPYACSMCDSKFAQSSHLQSHMMRHTKIKPFSCQFCDLKFSIKSSMVRHVKRHKAILVD